MPVGPSVYQYRNCGVPDLDLKHEVPQGSTLGLLVVIIFCMSVIFQIQKK